MTTLPEAHPALARRWNVEAVRVRLDGASRLRYTLYVYLASRLLFLVIAAIELLVVRGVGPHTALAHTFDQQGHPLSQSTLGSEFSNWDGKWYLLMASNWYGHWVPRAAGQYVTLGFMPLYSVAIWLVAHVTRIGDLGAGLAVSMICGGIATVQIGRLAEEWWGRERGRRAILFWCFFPGTVVFSMVYTEGMTLALISTCMILLQRRRWAWAGLCAGFATAIAPVALAAVPMCLAAAALELRRMGWRDRRARRALIAPILSPFGAIGFAIFLWFWVGTPLGDYRAQHVAWSESTTPLSIPHQFLSLVHELFVSGFAGHGPAGINLNVIAALVGTVFLLWGIKLLWEQRARIPVTVWVWTLCVAILGLTSSGTPPGPRLLIVAFPVVLAVGAAFDGDRYRRVLGWGVAATVVMTPITYVGLWLRP